MDSPNPLPVKPPSSDGPRRSQLPTYNRLWVLLVTVTLAFSVVPLTILALVSYSQHAEVVYAELLRETQQLTANAKSRLEEFVQQSEAALRFVVNSTPYETLCDEPGLSAVLKNIRRSFGSYVDLGVIDADGTQRAYVGPYDLKGKVYAEQDWFNRLRFQQAFFSSIFMGFRSIPHFAVAVKQERGEKDFFILRATVDAEVLARQVAMLHIRPSSDAFVINRTGILQTPSRLAGGIADKSPIECPPYSPGVQIQEGEDAQGEPYILGYAFIENSPFVAMILKRPRSVLRNLAPYRGRVIRAVLFVFIAIVVIVIWGATYLVRRIRVSELARARAHREMQHASKMATIGRLAAGVAHEINNPLAIINEKAGLIRDRMLMEEGFKLKENPVEEEYRLNEKIAEIADSIISSVERCSAVTHRLLGFAKRMDIRHERIQVTALIDEVLGFLGKEATYRNITVSRHFPEESPVIESDRGQIQQVLLNVVNNAFEAVKDGGRIDITVEREGEASVAITIADTGHGIAKEDIEHIFDPFFTTRKVGGTGLGLSISYGIIENLGGRITATSTEGQGATFRITLPLRTAL